MQLDIHQITHDAWNPDSQIASWAEIQTPYQLPADKMFLLPKGPEWNTSQVYARGVNLLAHNDLAGADSGTIQTLKDQGKTYHSVPITPELLGIGASGPDQWIGSFPDTYNRRYFPNGLPTYAQGFAYGQGCDVSHRVTIGETLENLHYTNPHAEFWRGYYDAKTPRLIERFGQNYRQAHDYLFIRVGPKFSEVNESEAKAFFRNPSSAPGWENTMGSQAKVNMYTMGVYLGGPDRDKRYVYDIALAARFYKTIGKYSVAFISPERDWMPNAKNGNKGNDGILYKENKTITPESVMSGTTIAGLHFGDGAIPWGGMHKVSNANKRWSGVYMQEFFNGSYWRKYGESEKRNWQSWSQLTNDTSYTIVDWRSCSDFQAFSAQAYAQTLGQVSGGQVKAASYKINNGAWYNAVNTFQDDLCYAKYHETPIVETVMNNGKEALFFCEPASNNKRKTITVRSQTGAEHTFDACGDTPHLAVWNT